MLGLDINSVTSIGVTIGIGLCTTLGTFAVKWGSLQTRLTQMDEARKLSVDADDKITDKLNAVTVTLERIGVALWGIDGQNGMRSELRELKADVKELRQEINDRQKEQE